MSTVNLCIDCKYYIKDKDVYLDKCKLTERTELNLVNGTSETWHTTCYSEREYFSGGCGRQGKFFEEKEK